MKFAGKLFIAAIAAVLTAATFSGSVGIRARAYTDVKEIGSNLMAAPSVIAEATNNDGFSAMEKAAVKPASALFGYDGGKAIFTDGTEAGTLKEVKTRLDKAGILLVLRVNAESGESGESEENEENGETLLADIAKDKLTDFSVMSGNGTLLKSVAENCEGVRVVYDASGKEPCSDPYDYVFATRTSGGNAVALSQEQTMPEVTEYLQARTVTVWTFASDETEVGFAELIATGCYGIIAKDYAALISLYGKYPKYSVPRAYYNVAHRGMAHAENENTLDGIEKAYECGATHVEIDIHVTKDAELVVMHDATIDRTTDGSGKISEMTKAELKNYSVIKNIDGKVTGKKSAIPFLDDVFAYCKDKDLIVVVEIKDGNSLTAPLLVSKIKKYGMQRNVMVISFLDGEGSGLESMNYLMPEIPIATLNTPTKDNLDRALVKAAKWNMAFDCSSGVNYSAFTNSNLKDRGYPLWQWTFEDASSAAIGITGLTNNDPSDFSGLIRKIEEPTELTIGKNKDISQAVFDVEAETFDGKTITVKAQAFVWERTENGYRAVLAVRDENSFRGLTRTVKAEISLTDEIDEESGEESENSSGQSGESDTGKGCGANANGGGFTFLLAAVAAALYIKTKKQ